MASLNQLVDSLIDLEADFREVENPNQSVLEAQKEEAKELWGKIKRSYSEFLGSEAAGVAKEVAAAKKKYKLAYTVYMKCIGLVGDLSTTQKEKAVEKSGEDSSMDHNMRLPPCDTEVFKGDYLSWPTFRDMFTAIYIKNKRLASVEKLCHLIKKTQGEAKDIVSKCPLTNEGFETAWKNLSDRYENKRILVNSQLKILFNLPPVGNESGSAIKLLQREINNCISALQIHKIDISNWDAIITYLCSTKLPEVTLSLWEQSVQNKTEIPKWSDMDKFLTSRFQTLETVFDLRGSQPTKSQQSKSHHEGNNKKLNTFQASVSNAKCKLCSRSSHNVRSCARFHQMTPSERSTYVRRNHLCLNCLSSGHGVAKCSSSYNCSVCQSRHHSLLHLNPTQANSAPTGDSSSSSPTGTGTTSKRTTSDYSRAQANSGLSSNVQSCFSNTQKGVLLGTAQINLKHRDSVYSARALIDSGSECSFITDRLRRRIGFPAKKVNASVSGINNTVAARSNLACSIQIGSPINPTVSILTTALVLPQLTGNLPTCNIDAAIQQNFPGIKLADSRFFANEQVDLVLGGDVYPQIILEGIRKDSTSNLLAQETVFGWILTGRTNRDKEATSCVSFYNEVALDQQLAAFWELEDIPRNAIRTADEEYCEEIYQATTTRTDSGRYTVSLPFRKNFPADISLGCSRKGAFSQYFRCEGRLAKNPSLREEYMRVLREYGQLGHMSEIRPSLSESPSESYYLPHHAVTKPESTSTKVRVVFNASCPSDNGVSLNDALLPGPILQSDLTILILRWRLFKFVFSSDIEKMYRQIFVHPQQRKFQRILFRESTDEPIRQFQLNTVTFGVNCAPYLAIRTLLQLADDVQDSHPVASTLLTRHMYVDDVLAGGHDLESTIKARDEISGALSSAGFPLRKWTANCKQVLRDIPVAHLLNQDFLDFENASSVKALGIRWNACSDQFYFTATDVDQCQDVTKRKILSAIAKLFDPLGWLAPIIIVAKMMMQNVWLEGTGWDEKVSSSTLECWHKFSTEYSAINNIRIPRWVKFSPFYKMELHGFCDASEKAYAAAIYMRVEEGEEVHINLLLAKTRVAPVKTISLPRLELCGAVLLAEMMDSVVTNLDLRSLQVYLWTDSTIVLAWLRKPPCSWSTFVSHRVTKIIDKVGQHHWFHVDSASNPADLASRGVTAPDLIANSLWWQGPSWLQEGKSEWPKQESVFQTDEEGKRVLSHATRVVEVSDILQRFSSLPRALRVLSYVFRFVQRTHPIQKVRFQAASVSISPEEIKGTTQRIIALCQQQHFSADFSSLKSGLAISAKSEILPLNPFIDSSGVLRIGGRLGASRDLSYKERHPILLPYNCHYSRLLVKFIHEISLHGEHQLMLRLIRAQYWIPRIKVMIKSVIHNCKVCTLYKKHTRSQIMASLPAERTTFSRAFTNTGVDFAGPFDIKNYRGRACVITKGYVCLFVCFATKAIHLEPTNDLSTATFLAAFSRFISRRGCPKNIYSDNGTNFVGASRALKAEFKAFLSDASTAVLSKYFYQELSWHFIPASAPHMGGLWEAGVKSFKTHFRKVASGLKYTFEEFSTLLCRIEACLNSRPLSPASNDPSTLEPLTPGHFLIGAPLLSPPEIEVSENPASVINRWQKMKALHHSFCQRWKNEYLTELQKRTKWKQQQPDMKTDDLVVIREDNLPPNEWRLGRVVDIHRGSDNRVRVVKVRTEKGLVTRPIVKLVRLPSTEPGI